MTPADPGAGAELQRLRDRARDLALRGRLETAEVLYRQVLAQVPRDAPTWIRHAETLKRLGRLDEAVLSYRTAAQVFLALGHENRAHACLKLALAMVPDDVDLVSDVIRVEMRRNRRAERPARGGQPEPPAPLEALKDPQLALPMLTEVDPRPKVDGSADSVLGRAELLTGPVEPPASVRGEAPALVALETAEADEREVYPQVRRLDDATVAIRPSPAARWIVVSASGPVDVRFEDELTIDDEAPWVE